MANENMVSVIIPTYHDWDRLALCIDALKKQSYPAELFEVIIVNNDPSDIVPDLHLNENFQLMSEARPGSYAARNAALAIAKGEIIAFTDSDCIPNEDWIMNAVARLKTGANRVAGRIDLFFKSNKLKPVEIYEKAYAFDQESNAKGGSSVTANMITLRKHFNTVGWFNDSLMSGGDIEWGWRANDLGITIQYASEVVVKHPARDSLDAMRQKRRRIAGGSVNINRKATRKSLPMLLIRGYLPPVRDLLKPWRKTEMTFLEKLIAMSMVYYFKVYTTTYLIGLLIELNKPERI